MKSLALLLTLTIFTQFAVAGFVIPEGPIRFVGVDCELSQNDLNQIVENTENNVFRMGMLEMERNEGNPNFDLDASIANYRQLFINAETSNKILKKCPNLKRTSLPFSYRIWADYHEQRQVE